MKNLFYILICVFLSSCAIQQNTPDRVTAKDGYRFLIKEYENLEPGVQFILIRNEEEREQMMKKVFGNRWKKIAGFTYWNENKKTCRIVVPDPAWKYQPEVIGHEVAHCIWGKFHKGEEGLGNIIDQPAGGR